MLKDLREFQLFCHLKHMVSKGVCVTLPHLSPERRTRMENLALEISLQRVNPCHFCPLSMYMVTPDSWGLWEM